MNKKMLIDASHPEETRMVVIDGARLEEFDFESAAKKRLRGNIYLAKVTRVEPSLQAAFVDYGGDRHGFLAFSEIHPDYYQVPIADRQALAEAEKAPADDDANSKDESDSNGESVEVVSGDEMDEIDRRRSQIVRRYRIQEVIKRRQILLVQVAKDERGTKGAALTTYLSLAGRYCVLMPNTGRGGGGISRKIIDQDDRRRLKSVIAGLPVADDMGVIVRTAGMKRTKSEIRRDFDYLVRQWDKIREMTLGSTAPTLIYEEGNLIKRSIRDLYTKDIEEILIEGDSEYRIAKDFMRTLIPSHAKRVQRYSEQMPLFHRFKVVDQLDTMYSPMLRLKSGGSIIINPTEALVAIDVNSGRATRERNIEETATKTNVEAAEEIARQLRLRDLAGLIVIDFIDMEESKNIRLVERRFKEAMKNDRARIQVGRISPFGLLELSRQRLRPSFFEASSQLCPQCGGSGHVRSIESTALHVLRTIEEDGSRNRGQELTVAVPTAVALYILNQKRAALRESEERNGFRILVINDDTLVPPACRLERRKSAASAKPAESAESADTAAGDKPPRNRRRRRAKPTDADGATDKPVDATAGDTDGEQDDTESRTESVSIATDSTRRRRRRGKRGGRRRKHPQSPMVSENAPGQDADQDDGPTGAASANDQNEPRSGPAPMDDVSPPEDADQVTKSDEVGAEAKSAEKKPRRRTARAERSETEEPTGKSGRRPRRRGDAKAVSEAGEEPSASGETVAAEEGKSEKKEGRTKASAKRTRKQAQDAPAQQDEATDSKPASGGRRRPRRSTKPPPSTPASKPTPEPGSVTVPDPAPENAEHPILAADSGGDQVAGSASGTPTSSGREQSAEPMNAVETESDSGGNYTSPKRAPRRGWWQRSTE